MVACQSIWILEDQEDLRTILSLVAQRRGFKPREMATLGEAWEVLHYVTKDPSYELPNGVISDFSLPDGTSEVWLMEIRERFPHIKIVCCSGNVPESIVKMLEAARIPCLPKPTHLSEVFDLMVSTPISER